MSDISDKFDLGNGLNGEHMAKDKEDSQDEDSQDDIELPDTDPQSSQFGLLRAAYVEHGKKIGALEERMEAMHLNLLDEMTDLKRLVIGLTETLRKKNDES